jgi:hypothetical protein
LLAAFFCCCIKAVTLSRLSDPGAPLSNALLAITVATLFGPAAWSFLCSLFVPFLAALPNFASLKARLVRMFTGAALVSSVFLGGVILAQLLDVDAEERIALRTTYLCMLILWLALA